MQVTDRVTPTLKQGDMKHVSILNCIGLGRSFHLEMVLQMYLSS